MSRTVPNSEVETTARRLELPRQVDALPSSDQRPLDWEYAVNAAACRLEESWVKPDATGYMAASGLADELAATLCAYGMVADEVAHMHGRIDELTPGEPRAPVEPVSPSLGLLIAAK